MTALQQVSPVAADDLELARRCARRDPVALRLVITTNNQRLFRAAWSIVKDRTEAEDVVQAAYLKAFDRIDEFEGRSALSTWLTRIVINESLGRIRANRRRKGHLDAEGVAVLETYREMLMRGSDPPAPDVGLAREQLRKLLERAVASLPDAFRSVFVLRDIEGLSVEETAEVLGLVPATVKTRLMRARRKMRDALAPEVGSAMIGTFPFAGANCEALTQKVLSALQSRE
nr:RNA polymerase sigma factor [uncultured Sphingomonas sp.]